MAETEHITTKQRMADINYRMFEIRAHIDGARALLEEHANAASDDSLYNVVMVLMGGMKMLEATAHELDDIDAEMRAA